MNAISFLLIVSSILGPLTAHAAQEDADVEVDQAAALIERAQRLWQARLDEDWAVVFEFMTPSEREGTTAEAYAQWAVDNEAFAVESFTLGDARVDGSLGWVQIDSLVRARQFGSEIEPVATKRWAPWLRINGTWYRCPPEKAEELPASPALRDAAEEESLRARFEASMYSRLHDDHERTYLYIAPQDRMLVTEEEFASALSRVNFRKFRTIWAEVPIGQDNAEVRAEMLIKPNEEGQRKMPPRWTVINESWVKVGGRWYWDIPVDGQAADLPEDYREPDVNDVLGPGPTVEPEVAAIKPMTIGSSSVAYIPSMETLPRTGQWKSDPVLSDVNGDGQLDLIAHPRLGTGPRLWLGDGQGGWREDSEGLVFPRGRSSCGGGLVVQDVNGDGRKDLVVADHCQGVYVYLATESGWDVVIEAMVPVIADDKGAPNMFAGAEDLDVGDVNGDGHVDIVASSSDEGGINVYLGDGTGQFAWTASAFPQTGWANRVQIRDMNADGHVDVIATFHEGPRIWHGDGANGWTLASSGLPAPSSTGIFQGLAIGDVNEDGRLDLVVGNWYDGVGLYLQNEDHSWQTPEDVFPTMRGGAYGIAVADFDADNHLDIIVAGRVSRDHGVTRGLHVLRGDGSGSFAYVPDCGLPNTGMMTISGVTLGDIDGNGLLDVAGCGGLPTEAAETQVVVPQHLLFWRALPRPEAPSDEQGQEAASE